MRKWLMLVLLSLLILTLGMRGQAFILEPGSTRLISP